MSAPAAGGGTQRFNPCFGSLRADREGHGRISQDSGVSCGRWDRAGEGLGEGGGGPGESEGRFAILMLTGWPRTTLSYLWLRLMIPRDGYSIGTNVRGCQG